VKPAEQLALLQDLYRQRFALMQRHVEGARSIADYENNNTYQYVIAREEIHVQWLRAAIEDVSGTVPTDVQSLAVPQGGKGADLERGVIQDDVSQGKALLERWRPRIQSITNARHRKMVELMFGEMLEQQRFFEMALEGRDDLLGRRMPGASTGGGVLPVRWVE
jgi:hypothetical protein